jgi:hypothetical protein
MNFSWPQRAAGKSVRRSAARIGLVGIAAVTVAGAAALAAPAMSAMAATGTNPTTTVVTNPLFPITEPVDTPATVDFEVTDNVAGGPAPTGTVNITTAAPWADNAGLPAGTVYQCTADLSPAAGVNGDGLAYSTGSCATGGVGWGFIELGATYSGDANNATSDTDGTEIKIVNLYPTTTTVTAPTGTAGKAVTLAATLGGPAIKDPGNVLAASPEIESAVPPNPDTINFTITNAADAVVATCPYVPLAGGTTAPANYADCTVPGTLAAGKYNVTAVFAGDEYAAGATGTGTLTVSAPKIATATKLAGVSAYAGAKTTLAATVAGGSSPTGTVKFVSGSKTLCSASVSKGAAHCTYTFGSVGSVSVKAVYGGDATHSASSSAAATVKVTKQHTSVKVTASKASTGKAVKLTVTVKALSAATGTVTIYVNGHKVGTAKVSGGKATYSYTWHAAGTYKVTAVYGGNSTHLASNGAVSVKVG